MDNCIVLLMRVLAFVSIVVFLCLLNARHAAAWIMKVLGGSRKESSKYLRVEGVARLYTSLRYMRSFEVASGVKYRF